MTRGFILGKFLPPHAGHLFACEVARNRVDELTVLVCSHDAEPIRGHLRAEWVRECLAQPGYRIVHMHRDIPQEPKEHPEFWSIWKSAILEHHPEPIDWVFGSEPYIHQLAAELGAKPFLVDLERHAFPVSGTDIRSRPDRHWMHIPQPVRPYYQTHVTLLGPESAGKSVLCTQLANEFITLAIPEYGRDYDATFKCGADWTTRDFLTIAEGQRSLSHAIKRRAGPVVFEDTDLLQTIVWSEALLGAAPVGLVQQLEIHTLPQLYLLLGPEMGWVDDGTRYHAEPETRTWFFNRLLHWLERIEADWTIISETTWDKRRERAMQSVRERLSQGPDHPFRRKTAPQSA